MKPVVTFDETELKRAVHALFERACDGHGRPDIVVGVATGGEVCARQLGGVVPVFSVTLRRRQTAAKKRTLLPHFLRFLLRQIEDWVGEYRSNSERGQRVGDVPVELQRDIDFVRSKVVELQARSILIMDDAVDSGVTLGCVVSAFQAALPDVSVSSAVLTHTRKESVFRADFALFDGVLCRFPWSFDYRAR